MVRIFIGFDSRQPVAYHVLSSSIMRRSSVPVAITPLVLDTLPITRRGLTDFTFARYLVPWLCNYEGTAVFMDSDMLVLGDVAEFEEVPEQSVRVVKFDEPHRYERPSVMHFNNALCDGLTPEYIQSGEPQALGWGSVGGLDPDWNFLVGYEDKREGVKLAHYTQGVPGYKECRGCDFADEWFCEREAMSASVSWLEIMGSSVHAPHVLKSLQARM